MVANKDVFLIRLLSGEELVTEITKDGGDFLSFKNPIRIMILPGTDPKNPRVALAPWGEFAATKEFTLDKTHILYYTPPIKEVLNQYIQMNGGIVTPPKSSIIINGS